MFIAYYEGRVVYKNDQHRQAVKPGNKICCAYAPDGWYFCTKADGHAANGSPSHVAHMLASPDIEIAEWRDGDPGIPVLRNRYDQQAAQGSMTYQIQRNLSQAFGMLPIPANLIGSGCPPTTPAQPPVFQGVRVIPPASTPPVATNPQPPVQGGTPPPAKPKKPKGFTYEPVDEWDLLPDED